MRILTVNTMDRSGGAEKIASDLVTHFRNNGHPTTFAVGRKRGGIADVEFPHDREYLPNVCTTPTSSGPTTYIPVSNQRPRAIPKIENPPMDNTGTFISIDMSFYCKHSCLLMLP